MRKYLAVLLPDDQSPSGSLAYCLREVLFTPVLEWTLGSLSGTEVTKTLLVSDDEEIRKLARGLRDDIIDCRTQDYGSVLGSVMESAGADCVLFISQSMLIAQPVSELLASFDGEDAVFCHPFGQRLDMYLTSRKDIAPKTAPNSARLFEKAFEEGRAAKFELTTLRVCHAESCQLLHTAQEELCWEIIERHMENGVMFIGDSSFISPQAVIGEGTVIYPNTIIKGKTVIGRGCRIGPSTLLEGAEIGDSTTVNSSQVHRSRIGSGSTVGPFTYIRPGCDLGDGIRIGDFVELKNSTVGDRSKVSHLTYVGDTDVGRGVNIGCGVVTVNYDGVNKYRTGIGDGAFIGCNTNLIAPVSVGEGAYTAAGTTITHDVPPGALAIGRVRQSVKEDWAKGKLKKKD